MHESSQKETTFKAFMAMLNVLSQKEKKKKTIASIIGLNGALGININHGLVERNRSNPKKG